MALNLTASKVVVPVAPKAPRVTSGNTPGVQPRAPVVNGVAARQMLTWTPHNNKFFETLSYLPPLTEDEIAHQVHYITRNGWTPCLEFADSEHAYISSKECVRFGPITSNYNDNKYWTMWKLPMFGCTDPSQVQQEIYNCVRTFPDAYLRIVGFDSVRQVQVAGFLVHRPANATDYQDPDQRSVGETSMGGGGGGRRGGW
ncbi:hypothetical protein BSKO_11616 [Bryopsis sp. KO-2023]|nr:hypothetical protein BSKO_11616 [Bryopsis sp. KO-2023]